MSHALLCEGGAVLHGELLKADCVDEIFIAHAPKLAGGRGPGLTDGLDPAVRAARGALARLGA